MNFSINSFRLVTMIMYLNDLPNGQGCTEFPALNIKMTPIKGLNSLFF